MSMLKLSEKHGLNPCVIVCFYCGDETGEIVFAGRLKNDAEAPRRAAIDRQPCQGCRDLMAQGVMFISVDESKTTDHQNPHRSGAIAVLKDEAVRKIITPPALAEAICLKRMAFVPDEVWDALGLSRTDFPPRPESCPD